VLVLVLVKKHSVRWSTVDSGNVVEAIKINVINNQATFFVAIHLNQICRDLPFPILLEKDDLGLQILYWLGGFHGKASKIPGLSQVVDKLPH